MIDGYKNFKTQKAYIWFANPETGQKWTTYVYKINNDASFKKAYTLCMRDAQKYYEQNL